MKAKYKITTWFGTREKGDVIDCIVLNRDGDKALIYHKPNNRRGECGSFELCELNSKNQWVTLHDQHYINQSHSKDMACEFSEYLKSL